MLPITFSSHQWNANYKNSIINGHHAVKMRSAINCTLRPLQQTIFVAKTTENKL